MIPDDSGQFSDAEENSDGDCCDIKNKTEKNVKKRVTWDDKLIEVSEDEYGDNDDCDSEEEYAWDSKNGKNKIIDLKSQHYNPQKLSDTTRQYQPSEKLFHKFKDRINIDFYENETLKDIANNDVNRIKTKDKSDRATVEQVMDPRTRMILFKLLNRGTINQIDGCFSTGKEANVYHAIGPGEMDIAVKIYKTSILVFKDRSVYITGEFRFRRGYNKHNPRKMVQTWAEKEMRNLVRFNTGGVPVPKPILLKGHVLLMEFIGKNGWPAQKLKDAEISLSKACQLYRDCLLIMWKIYNVCKLVHADFSEFNILYQDGQLHVIDVSQAVEWNHPYALVFLRSDCTNITNFFRKKGVATLTMKELFNFITDPSINEKNVEEYLDKAAEAASNEPTAEDIQNDQVFKNSYIPKTLSEVIDFERDIEQSKTQDAELIYEKMLGLKCDDKEDEKETSEESEEETDSDAGEKTKFVNSRRPRGESAQERNERKKAVKEEKAERRKNKIKKHVKKRKEKMSRHVLEKARMVSEMVDKGQG